MQVKILRRLLWLAPGSMVLASGCDTAANIVFASLDLAAAIVAAAT